MHNVMQLSLLYGTVSRRLRMPKPVSLADKAGGCASKLQSLQVRGRRLIRGRSYAPHASGTQAPASTALRGRTCQTFSRHCQCVTGQTDLT
jgi:hypothetical protein